MRDFFAERSMCTQVKTGSHGSLAIAELMLGGTVVRVFDSIGYVTAT